MLAPPPLPRTLEAALRDIGSQTPKVRAAAVGDLVGHARAQRSLLGQATGLIEKLLRDPAAEVRAAAAVGLGDLDAAEALPSLLVAIEDDDAHVRQMALTAVGEIGDARALPRLRRAFGDARPEMRYQAIIALGHVLTDDAELASVLTTALSDADPAIRYIALRVAEESLDAGRALPADGLIEGATKLLGDPGVGCAVAAAIVLARLGDARGRDVVLAIVEGRAGRPACEKEDERAAVELAGELGLREAIPALERRAFGVLRHVRDTCTFHARVALARLGHPRVVEETLRDLEANRRETVEAAVVIVGRAHLEAGRTTLERLTAHRADPALVAEALARFAPK